MTKAPAIVSSDLKWSALTGSGQKEDSDWLKVTFELALLRILGRMSASSLP